MAIVKHYHLMNAFTALNWYHLINFFLSTSSISKQFSLVVLLLILITWLPWILTCENRFYLLSTQYSFTLIFYKNQ